MLPVTVCSLRKQFALPSGNTYQPPNSPKLFTENCKIVPDLHFKHIPYIHCIGGFRLLRSNLEKNSPGCVKLLPREKRQGRRITQIRGFLCTTPYYCSDCDNTMGQGCENAFHATWSVPTVKRVLATCQLCNNASLSSSDLKLHFQSAQPRLAIQDRQTTERVLFDGCPE